MGGVGDLPSSNDEEFRLAYMGLHPFHPGGVNDTDLAVGIEGSGVASGVDDSSHPLLDRMPHLMNHGDLLEGHGGYRESSLTPTMTMTPRPQTSSSGGSVQVGKRLTSL